MNSSTCEGIDEENKKMKQPDNIGKNVQITIHQLANGFLVQPMLNQSDPACYSKFDEEYVFESMEGLTRFLRNHFSHRNNNVLKD